MKLMTGRFRQYKAFIVPPGVLIVLCLLYLCVQGTPSDVNTAALAKMIQYFDANVQPKTKPDVQYAMAISVPQAQCTDEQADIQTVFSQQDAEHVRNVLTIGETCVLCTPSKNVIAARPAKEKPKEHAEHVLLYPLGNSLMDKLLAQADQYSCIIFYSYLSPCVTRCIQSKDSILEGLSKWIKKQKDGINVFVFEKIWHKDIWRKDLKKDFQKIDEKVPFYWCNKMGCKKCVENNEKVQPFCLLD